MAVVQPFDALLQADGDEQPDDDGGDVDEEVASDVDGCVGWVDVEHFVSYGVSVAVQALQSFPRMVMRLRRREGLRQPHCGSAATARSR
jgi:hypothetical protein